MNFWLKFSSSSKIHQKSSKNYQRFTKHNKQWLVLTCDLFLYLRTCTWAYLYFTCEEVMHLSLWLVLCTWGLVLELACTLPVRKWCTWVCDLFLYLRTCTWAYLYFTCEEWCTWLCPCLGTCALWLYMWCHLKRLRYRFRKPCFMTAALWFTSVCLDS